jgi:hypothetical protein
MQPASPCPRKIGSARTVFENKISKNKANSGHGSESFLTGGVSESPRVISSLKKYRSSTPRTPAKDAIVCPVPFATPSASMKLRMATFSSVSKLPFGGSGDTPDPAGAKPSQGPSRATKVSDTTSSADTRKETESTSRGVKKGLVALKSLKKPRSSVKSADALAGIASISDRNPLNYEGKKKLVDSPSDSCSTTSAETEASMESETRSRRRLNRESSPNLLYSHNDDEDSIVFSTASPMISRQSLFPEPSTPKKHDNENSLRQTRPRVKASCISSSESEGKGEGGDCDSSADTPKERSHFRSNRKGENEVSVDTLPEEPLPLSPKKNRRKKTGIILIHKDQAPSLMESTLRSPDEDMVVKAVSDGRPSRSDGRPSQPSSRSLTPEQRPNKGRLTHSLSPLKKRKPSVATVRSILKQGKSHVTPIECYEEKSRGSGPLTSQRSRESLLRGNSKKGRRVTFADEVSPRQQSRMTISNKDTLPKQPRRNSMSDVDEVRRRSNCLKDPILLKGRARRAAARMQDFVRRKLRRIGFVKIIAATRIQAIVRGVMQRMRHRIAMLEQRLAKIGAKRKRELRRIQAFKWKVMDAYKKKVQEGEDRREHDVTTIDRVIEELERENSRIRDQNSKIQEASFLLEMMNEQIESTLQIHNANFETMRETIGIITERNVRTIRMSKKYRTRIDKVKQKVVTAEKCGIYENNARMSMEHTTTEMIASFESRTGHQELVDTITAMRLTAGAKDASEEGMSSSAGDVEVMAFELSFRVSDEMTIWSDVSSVRELEEVLAPLGRVFCNEGASHEGRAVEEEVEEDDYMSNQSSVYVDTSAVILT